MSKTKGKLLEVERQDFERTFTPRTNILKREKSVETISTSGSRSYSRSRSRSRSQSRSRSRSRSRSLSFSKSRSRSRPHYRYSFRDNDGDMRPRSPKYYRRTVSRSRSRSPNRNLSYRRYRPSYRTKSPIYMRTSYRTIRYDRYLIGCSFCAVFFCILIIIYVH